jgi:uncharacterized protein YwgA
MLNSDHKVKENDDKEINIGTIHVDNILPENAEETNIKDNNKRISDQKLIDENINTNNEDLATEQEIVQQTSINNIIEDIKQKDIEMSIESKKSTNLNEISTNDCVINDLGISKDHDVISETKI